MEFVMSRSSIFVVLAKCLACVGLYHLAEEALAQAAPEELKDRKVVTLRNQIAELKKNFNFDFSVCVTALISQLDSADTQVKRERAESESVKWLNAFFTFFDEDEKRSKKPRKWAVQYVRTLLQMLWERSLYQKHKLPLLWLFFAKVCHAQDMIDWEIEALKQSAPSMGSADFDQFLRRIDASVGWNQREIQIVTGAFDLSEEKQICVSLDLGMCYGGELATLFYLFQKLEETAEAKKAKTYFDKIAIWLTQRASNFDELEPWRQFVNEFGPKYLGGKS